MRNETLKLCYAALIKRSPVLTASVIVLVPDLLLPFSARPVGERTAISPLCIPFSELAEDIRSYRLPIGDWSKKEYLMS